MIDRFISFPVPFCLWEPKAFLHQFSSSPTDYPFPQNHKSPLSDMSLWSCSFVSSPWHHLKNAQTARSKQANMSLFKCGTRPTWSACAQPEKREIDSLMDWCRDAGIVSPALTIRVINGQRGLFATRDITPGEELFCIPRKACLISETTDSEAPPLKVLTGLDREFWVDAPWHLRLSILLLDQQLAGVSSKFHPYLSALPANPTCVLWAYEHYGRAPVISSLSRYHMDTSADLYHKLIKSRYQRFRKALPKHLRHLISLKRFCWSLSNVASRAFAIPPPQHFSCNILQFALLPMLDMANASTHVPTSIRYSRESQMIRVVTGASYRAGDQVFVSYGSKSNDEFMFFYGFVEGDNPANTVTITDFREWVLELGHRVSLDWDCWDRKLRVLREAGVLDHDRIFSFGMDKLDDTLLFVLRITIATSCQLEAYQEKAKRNSSKKAITTTIDLENELAVWQAVREKCEAMLLV